MQKKYLTEEKFEEWKGNDFKHVSDACYGMIKKLARMEGVVWVLAPLAIAILTIVIVMVRNG